MYWGWNLPKIAKSIRPEDANKNIEELLMHHWVTRTAEAWTEKMKINLVTPKQWPQIGEKLDLAERELEVIKLLFEQLTRDQIAEKMGIKSRTVRQYMENIHEKLRVTNRIGVVLRIIQIRDSMQKNTN